MKDLAKALKETCYITISGDTFRINGNDPEEMSSESTNPCLYAIDENTQEEYSWYFYELLNIPSNEISFLVLKPYEELEDDLTTKNT